MKFIYVMGMPFSGTTLLSRLVLMHPEIATIGEMVNVIHKIDRGTYLCSCGVRLVDCSFWLGVKTRMARRGQDFDLLDFRIKPPQRIAGIFYKGAQFASSTGVAFKHLKKIANAFSSYKAHSSLSERVRAFSESVLEQSGRSIFFDASKDPNLLFYLVGSKHFRPVFVHMVRDPRGVAVSMMNNLSRSCFDSCISEWLTTNEKIAYLLSLFPLADMVTMRYEHLSATPFQELENLWDLIEAGGSDVNLLNSPDSHIIGNRMRLSSLDKIKLHEKWVQLVNDRDMEVARKIAGPFAERFGYSL
jgi:hypothetical protein